MMIIVADEEIKMNLVFQVEVLQQLNPTVTVGDKRRGRSQTRNKTEMVVNFACFSSANIDVSAEIRQKLLSRKIIL